MDVAHQRRIGFAISLIMRAHARTLRMSIVDRSGLVNDRGRVDPAIWCFWHNRMLLIPSIQRRWIRHRTGSAMTSTSSDGEIMAEIMHRFGFGAIRGSSSRRGARALVELRRVLESGKEAAISPDGPRGPRYRLNPGVILLAQISGAPVLPFRIDFEKYIRLRSWDGFIIPHPLSRVHVTVGPLHHVPPTTDDEAFEAERLRLEQAMRATLIPE